MPWNGWKTGISLTMKVRLLGDPYFSESHVLPSCSEWYILVVVGVAGDDVHAVDYTA